MAFGATLAMCTWTQRMIFGISTGTMAPIPSLAGMVSVAVASMASHHVASSSLLQLPIPPIPSIPSIPPIPPITQWQLPPSLLSWDGERVAHCVRVCLVGMLIYRGVLGGKFWSVSPSSFTNLGSFARRGCSLPATNQSYATAAQRQQIESLGRRYGCHTCGSRMIFHNSNSSSNSFVRFHADHMPPRSVVTARMDKRNNVRFFRKLRSYVWNSTATLKQRFYPQCIHCSTKQGQILGQATQQLRSNYNAIMTKQQSRQIRNIKPHFLTKSGGGRNAHFHGLRPRLSHLTGALLAAITISPSINTNTPTHHTTYNNYYDKHDPFRNIQDTITHNAQTLLSWIQTNFK